MKPARGLARLLLVALICLPAAVAGGQPASEAGRPDDQFTKRREALAEADVRWIAARTGWAKQSVPVIESRSAEQLAVMFFGSADGFDGIRPLALYARDEHILFLADEIALDTLADQSILLHELVHHLQILNEVHLKCREEAEAQAYGLQIQWLREQGVRDPYALLGLSRDEIATLRCS